MVRKSSCSDASQCPCFSRLNSLDRTRDKFLIDVRLSLWLHTVKCKCVWISWNWHPMVVWKIEKVCFRHQTHYFNRLSSGQRTQQAQQHQRNWNYSISIVIYVTQLPLNFWGAQKIFENQRGDFLLYFYVTIFRKSFKFKFFS